MKKTLLFIMAIIALSFIKKPDIATLPQANGLLYANIIFSGKVIKVSENGCSVLVQEIIYNAANCKNIEHNKIVFITYPIVKSNRSYFSIPTLNDHYIFTTTYTIKTGKITPFYYTLGLILDKENKSYVFNSAYTQNQHLDYKTIVEGIKLLRKTYQSNNQLWAQLEYKCSATKTQIEEYKKQNAAAKIWIEEIEQQNNRFKKQ